MASESGSSGYGTRQQCSDHSPVYPDPSGYGSELSSLGGRPSDRQEYTAYGGDGPSYPAPRLCVVLGPELVGDVYTFDVTTVHALAANGRFIPKRPASGGGGNGAEGKPMSCSTDGSGRFSPKRPAPRGGYGAEGKPEHSRGECIEGLSNSRRPSTELADMAADSSLVLVYFATSTHYHTRSHFRSYARPKALAPSLTQVVHALKARILPAS